MKADPSWSRHAILGTWTSALFHEHCMRTYILDNSVGTSTDENTERSPQLPSHDKSTSDNSRRKLSSVHWDSSGFGTHSNTENKTNGEELVPILRESRSDRGQNENDGSDEDFSSSSEPVVERI
jgi:hypothetical protein